MSWEREPLFTKAKLFFEKAFNEDKEEPSFGLWCAMGLELLARSAVSNVSPTLLADPDPGQQNLLHALNHGSSKTQRKSIASTQVLSLCKTLITDFTDAEFKITSAIINRRNEELHTGGAAFEEYPTQQWISGFYKCCKILSESQGESLNSLFGDEIEREAEIILAEVAKEILEKTKSLIAAHKKVFENKDAPEQNRLRADAQKAGEMLSTRGHHKVKCPACECIGTITGEPYGKITTEHRDGEIIVRQSILPTKFNCSACELKLNGYNALLVADIGNHYTRRTTYSPEAYYNLIDPDDSEAIRERYNELGLAEDENEYDNE
jgi:hypothetical protein